MLSEAKHLSVHRDRPFAEFTLSEANGLRVTGIRSKYLGRSAIECELRHSHVMICNVHYESLIIFNQHTGFVNVAENSGSVPGTRKGYHYISDPARPKM
jgi:hypothetical protein